jgi:predicted DNA-binding protein with PD1-like motif
MNSYAFRIRPGMDLKLEIAKHVLERGITAGFVASAVGYLKHVRMSLGGTQKNFDSAGSFTIVAITGTISVNGNHLHMVVSDEEGKTVGGHVKEGCTVKSAVEVILVETEGVSFEREFDEDTGFYEIMVRRNG